MKMKLYCIDLSDLVNGHATESWQPKTKKGKVFCLFWYYYYRFIMYTKLMAQLLYGMVIVLGRRKKLGCQEEKLLNTCLPTWMQQYHFIAQCQYNKWKWNSDVCCYFTTVGYISLCQDYNSTEHSQYYLSIQN